MKEVRLGDVADVYISGVDKKTLPNEVPVRLCNYTDVYYNWAIRKEKHQTFMLASAKQDEIAKFRLHTGQVAITKDSETRDDIGHATFIANDFEDVILGYHCALITPCAGKLDGQYLNALFRMHYVSDYLSRNAGGSGQRYYLSESAIKSIPLFLPPIATQLRIAGVLGSIDEKIELNRKKIAELEALAKTIYDYWFVQFDFPDANGKPYQSSGGKMVWNEQLKRKVPAGWETCAIGQLCNCHDSKRIPLSGKQRAEMQGNIPYYGATGVMDYVNKYIFEGEYLLFAEDGSVMSDDGFPILQIINGKTWVNNHAHVLSPRINCSVKFLQLHFQKIPVRKIKTGSIQPKITKDNLFSFRVLSIPMSILGMADNIFDPIQKNITIVARAITDLTHLRDALLPLLMNGQVEVAG